MGMMCNCRDNAIIIRAYLRSHLYTEKIFRKNLTSEPVLKYWVKNGFDGVLTTKKLG